MATQYAKRDFLVVVISALLFLALFSITYASSTIGTNMSTTGTFTQTVGSANAARFQNAAGTTTVLWVDTTSTLVGVNAGGAIDTTFEVGGTASVSGISTYADGRFRPQSNAATAFRFQNAGGTTSILTIDTTNTRVGIGATPGTTFEVQGTASASYFLTGNTIQVGGFSSVAYSRFGTNATGDFLTNSNDLLVSGRLEVDASIQFDKSLQIQGTASASYFLTANTIQVAGNASAAYSRFGTDTTGYTSDIDASNDLLISGALEVNGKVFLDGTASVSDRFELTSTTSRLGINAGAFTNTVLEVGGTASISGIASVSGNFAAGTGNTGTSSFNFDAPSTSVGSCFRIKDNDGSGYTYLRVSNGAGTFSTVDCR